MGHKEHIKIKKKSKLMLILPIVAVTAIILIIGIYNTPKNTDNSGNNQDIIAALLTEINSVLPSASELGTGYSLSGSTTSEDETEVIGSLNGAEYTKEMLDFEFEKSNEYIYSSADENYTLTISASIYDETKVSTVLGIETEIYDDKLNMNPGVYEKILYAIGSGSVVYKYNINGKYYVELFFYKGKYWFDITAVSEEPIEISSIQVPGLAIVDKI